MVNRCNTTKHRKQIKKEKNNTATREDRIKEANTRKWAIIHAARKNAEMQERARNIHLQHIVNLLSFHLWQIDPRAYDKFSKDKHAAGTMQMIREVVKMTTMFRY